MTAAADRLEQAAVLALARASRQEWYRTAALIEQVGSALRLLRRDLTAWDGVELEEVDATVGIVDEAALDEYLTLIDDLQARDVALTTVLDESYPRNLRLIYNRPPFLFVKGQWTSQDERSVAIVGTRAASDTGREIARRLATELGRHGVTVLSGLALGIDTAAHRGALDAGGRTIAVLGTGVDAAIYPRENRTLADEIRTHGALVSQFLPNSPPTRHSFLMRNVVMSGMAIGTVVIEASSTSGAKSQARHALEHGKRLFLLDELVMHQDWAKRYAERPGATVVSNVDDILHVLVAAAQPVEQLRLV